MSLNKTDFVGFVAIVVILVSIAFMGFQITGLATVTDTAIVNVTVGSNADIQFIQNYVDFGSGVVNTSVGDAARINTEGTVENGTWAPNTAKLVLKNIGNANISLSFNSSKTAEEFIGVSNAEFRYKVDGIHCIVNSKSGYTSFTDTTTACEGFEPTREIDLHVEIIIPSEAGQGEKIATITAIGTTVGS